MFINRGSRVRNSMQRLSFPDRLNFFSVAISIWIHLLQTRKLMVETIALSVCLCVSVCVSLCVCLCLWVCATFSPSSPPWMDTWVVSMVTNVNWATLKTDVQMSLCWRSSANTQEWYDPVILYSVLRSLHVDSQKAILVSILTSSVYKRLLPSSVCSHQHLGLFSWVR